jgi:hypothetical protein
MVFANLIEFLMLLVLLLRLPLLLVLLLLPLSLWFNRMLRLYHHSMYHNCSQ